MASSRSRSLRLLPAALVAGAVGVAWAQTDKSGPRIYTCTDASGKRITADHPIPECLDKDQKELRPDGSVKRVVPPTPTADERAAQEARERTEQAERVARQDAIRRDRNLMARFPNKAAHDKARKAALDDSDNAVRLSEARIKLLQDERKKLDDETEFYPGKPLPSKLRSALDANDAALEAQRSLIQNQKDELVRINANYDAELLHLEQLWNGAPAGSMGAASGPNSGPSATGHASARSAGSGLQPTSASSGVPAKSR
jgi:hypothetical protein